MTLVRPWAICLLVLLPPARPLMAAPPGSTPPVPRTPPPPPLFDFVPSPLALPGAEAAREKQIAALLRGFTAIQRAEVLLTGEGPSLSLQVLVRLQPGATLDPAACASLLQVLTAAVPGLSPERINVATQDGALLISRGVVQSAATPPRPSVRQVAPYALLAVLLAGRPQRVSSGGAVYVSGCATRPVSAQASSASPGSDPAYCRISNSFGPRYPLRSARGASA